MRHIFVVGALVTFILNASALQAAQPQITKIDAKVRQSLLSKTSVRVLVRLNEPIKTQERLTPEEKQQQNARITAAQDSLLRELDGVPHRIVRRYEIIPTFSMEIGVVALAALERSPRVARVYEVERLRGA